METVHRSASLTDQAVESIRSGIVRGDLAPGELYTATELGRQIGVSRTPVREALLELSRRGLVEIVPNRGARILNTSETNFLEIFQVRLMLEVPLAARATQLKTPATVAEVEDAYVAFAQAAASGDSMAVLRADRDFHRALLAGAGNSKASRLLMEQRDLVLETGVGTVPTSRSAQECFEDHADIMAAYRNGDPASAGAAVARHIAHTAKMLLRQEGRTRESFAKVDADAAIDWLVDMYLHEIPPSVD